MANNVVEKRIILPFDFDECSPRSSMWTTRRPWWRVASSGGKTEVSVTESECMTLNSRHQQRVAHRVKWCVVSTSTAINRLRSLLLDYLVSLGSQQASQTHCQWPLSSVQVVLILCFASGSCLTLRSSVLRLASWRSSPAVPCFDRHRGSVTPHPTRTEIQVLKAMAMALASQLVPSSLNRARKPRASTALG